MAVQFKCPVQKLAFEISQDTFSSSEKYKDIVLEHYFNHSMTVIAPSSSGRKQVEEIMITVSKQQYYTVHKVPLTKLINVEFIEAFVKRGNMYMLSCDGRIDTSDVSVALYPPGRLILNMNKDTYTQLGLEGRPSKFSGKQSSRYVVNIDLVGAHFHPGKKNYQRVEWCFTDRLNLVFDFIAAWVPFDIEICPSSIAAYFSSSGLMCTVGVHRMKWPKSRHMLVPHIDKDASDTESCCMQEFHEWLGFVACGCDTSDEEYISTYRCPEPNTNGTVLLASMSGFCTPESIIQATTDLRQLMRSEHLPWICLTVHGFADSPVSWKHSEHGYSDNGDNLYTAVLFPGDHYWLYTATGTRDMNTPI